MKASGDILQQRYRILGILGEGGMGAVYLAEDLRLPGKQWAVKEMKLAKVQAALGSLEDAVRQFREEARLLADLRHENLPHLVDLFEEGGAWFMVMERVPGKTLQQIMQERKTPLNEEEARNVALQVLDAMEYLHSRPRPIIYRDLKPSNLMITPQNRVVLVDFGIARFFDAEKRTDTFKMGSNGYAPPEQYRGKGHTDPRSDLYALGALLHYLVTGRDPQMEAPFFFPPARSLNPSVSPKMEVAILRALELDREHRFPSAHDMAKALAGSGGLLWRMGPIRRLMQTRWPFAVQLLPTSRKEQFILLRILLVILAFALAHLTWQVVHERRQRAARSEASLHWARATTQMERGRFEEAALGFEKVLELRGEESLLLFHLGLARSRAGEDARARESLERVTRLNPQLADARRELAALALRRKDGAEALSQVTQALAVASGDAALLLLQAEALDLLHRSTEARAAREEFSRRCPVATERAGLEKLYLGGHDREGGGTPTAPPTPGGR